jgi:hypothetical protein
VSDHILYSGKISSMPMLRMVRMTMVMIVMRVVMLVIRIMMVRMMLYERDLATLDPAGMF